MFSTPLRFSRFALTAILAICLPGAALAANFSFTGNIGDDDDVLLFNFTVGSASTVTLLTYSYAGGTNAMGTLIAQGGFDPILAVFDSTGALIGQNDDGSFPNVDVDSVTGATFDTWFQALLGPGDYMVSVSQFNNFALGPNLSNGFGQTGNSTFTSAFGCSQGFLCDVTGDNRTSAWAFDLLDVGSATGPGNIPEPTTLLLFGGGLAALFLRRRKA